MQGADGCSGRKIFQRESRPPRSPSMELRHRPRVKAERMRRLYPRSMERIGSGQKRRPSSQRRLSFKPLFPGIFFSEAPRSAAEHFDIGPACCVAPRSRAWATCIIGVKPGMMVLDYAFFRPGRTKARCQGHRPWSAVVHEAAPPAPKMRIVDHLDRWRPKSRAVCSRPPPPGAESSFRPARAFDWLRWNIFQLGLATKLPVGDLFLSIG